MNIFGGRARKKRNEGLPERATNGLVASEVRAGRSGPEPDNPLRILSIDGGGIRGLVPSLVLEQVEKVAKRPVSEMFDVVTGVSSGALVAMALFKSKKPLRAADVSQLFRDKAGQVFEAPFIRTPLFGINSVRYDSTGLRGLIEDLVGKAARLSDCSKRVLVPAIDLRSRRVKLFDSSRDGSPYKLIDVALATTAAPTYFDPHSITLGDGEPSRRAYVDGGLAANDPAAFAVARHWDDIQSRGVILASLGTGKLMKGVQPAEFRNAGAIEWAPELASLTIDSSAHATARVLRELFANASASGPRCQMFRLNPPLVERIGLDDGSDRTLKELSNAFYTWAKDDGDDLINELVQALTGSR